MARMTKTDAAALIRERGAQARDVHALGDDERARWDTELEEALTVLKAPSAPDDDR